LRELANDYHLLVQEEARPVAIALFGTPDLTVHFGFDQANIANPDWYTTAGHPYVIAICKILDEIASWEEVKRLEFLISPGDDPMTGLQVKLNREPHPKGEKPSAVCGHLAPQTIYSFVND